MKRHELNDCSDSTSSLGTEVIYFRDYPEKPHFSIDVGIVCRDTEENYNRLIHRKTGISYLERYYWNQAPNSHNVKMKSKYIIQQGAWDMLAQKYLKLKNIYLCGNDYNHPSFICYIEAVNNVYDTLRKKR